MQMILNDHFKRTTSPLCRSQ